jgi:hypothetical protein
MITKSMPATGRFHAILCVALMATCPHVSALQPRPRVLSGKIEAIDRTARLLRVRGDFEAASLTLVWNDRTRFFEGSRIVTAAELTKGTSVVIWYGTPFFGERYATKIVIGEGPVRSAKRQPPRSISARR